MPASRGQIATMRIARIVGAWALLLILAWLAWGMYGDYRSTPKSPGALPGSTPATQSVEPTGTDASAEATTKPVGTKPTVTVLAEGLNLRKKPMTSADVIKKLKSGSSLELLETANGWYRVRDNTGDEGWVAAGGNYSELVK